MKFDLVRPCKDCPFRTDVTPYLTARRVREITGALIRRDQTFACHKTIKSDEDGDTYATGESQHCAGATIMLERLGRPNQMMRIAERLRVYDRSKLDLAAPVYATPALMAAAQRRGNKSLVREGGPAEQAPSASPE